MPSSAAASDGAPRASDAAAPPRALTDEEKRPREAARGQARRDEKKRRRAAELERLARRKRAKAAAKAAQDREAAATTARAERDREAAATDLRATAELVVLRPSTRDQRQRTYGRRPGPSYLVDFVVPPGPLGIEFDGDRVSSLTGWNGHPAWRPSCEPMPPSSNITDPPFSAFGDRLDLGDQLLAIGRQRGEPVLRPSGLGLRGADVEWEVRCFGLWGADIVRELRARQKGARVLRFRIHWTLYQQWAALAEEGKLTWTWDGRMVWV